MSEQKFICQSKNGQCLTYDPVHSHAATHLEDTPQLESLVVELVGDIDLTDHVVAGHFDMGRVIGTSDVVSVDESDSIVYAVRKNRLDDGRVPFTKTRDAEPCRYLAVHLVPRDSKSYELLSAWIGTFGDDEPFPESPDANVASKEYWAKHAFVWGSQEIVPGSQVSKCPW